MQKYYGSLLESTCDLQTSASSCSMSCHLPKSVREALSLVHPEVTKKYVSQSYRVLMFAWHASPACSFRSLSFSVCSPMICTVILLCDAFSSRFFGCGLPFPAKLEGCRVLDLGSGSGRDSYAFSKLVGPNGHVTGIDMTEELVITHADLNNA